MNLSSPSFSTCEHGIVNSGCWASCPREVRAHVSRINVHRIVDVSFDMDLPHFRLRRASGEKFQVRNADPVPAVTPLIIIIEVAAEKKV